MPNNRNTRYESLGLQWVQIDAQREALFEFILEVAPGQEPIVKTIVPTIPNITGQGDQSRAIYPMRPVRASISPTAIDQPTPGIPFERKPGLSIVSPTDEQADPLKDIPSRKDKREQQ